MAEAHFTGDKKLPMTTLLAPLEKRFIDDWTPRFPRWIQGWHLTLLTLLWSAGVVVFGCLAGLADNLHWLWGSSAMLVLQWFTDCFDGALGRYRDFGIPKWGFYMDHLLDFVFLCALLAGYSFLLDDIGDKQMVYFLIPVFGTFMVSSFLSFGATGQFKITYLGVGPTEMRVGFIAFNAILIFFGTAWIQPMLPYVLAVSVGVLCVVVFRTQRYIWNRDMADKKARRISQDDKPIR
ncbi:MAG: CDP-alcohol phosphatidyltransferase family protein [Sedimentisphaerales bacterium]|nr:CDP-alcohol phosphatidyltransferase family protein [Sedimentisphaerales bacterium]